MTLSRKTASGWFGLETFLPIRKDKINLDNFINLCMLPCVLRKRSSAARVTLEQRSSDVWVRIEFQNSDTSYANDYYRSDLHIMHRVLLN